MRRPAWDVAIGEAVCFAIAAAFWGGLGWLVLEAAQRVREALFSR